LEEVLKQASNDYVTVILTDKIDLDIVDMQDRIRAAFPNILEIRRELPRKADYSKTVVQEENLSPFELCCRFLKITDSIDQALLQDVIHTVQGVK